MATCTFTPTEAGQYTFQTVYSGDTDFATSTGTGPVTVSAPAAAGWVVTPSQNAGTAADNDLVGVSCSSSTFCVAVGNSPTGTVIEMFDGTAWTLVSPSLNGPSGSSASELQSVSCYSPTFCAAVGFYTASSGLNQDLIDTWNGMTWTDTSYNPDSDEALWGVSCRSASSCIAVGSYENSASFDQALILTWNGTAWSLSSGAVDTSTTEDNYLYSVSCTNDFCMAAGFSSDDGVFQTLAQTWNGTTWTLSLPQNSFNGLEAESNLLQGVSCISAEFCEAVGYNATGTLAETFNGSTWTISPSITPGSSSQVNQLQGVSCTDDSFCMATGYYTGSGGGYQTLAETLDRDQLDRESQPEPQHTGQHLSRSLLHHWLLRRGRGLHQRRTTDAGRNH